LAEAASLVANILEKVMFYLEACFEI